ncbi:MAG: hypothetical protein ACR2LV_08855 [Solirubrobacteraceae bacterium]
MRALCLIGVLAGVLLAEGCSSKEAASGRPIDSSDPALGRVALLRPELARVATAVRVRWHQHGLSTTFEGVPQGLGPARIALSTGTAPARVTLYLYDSASEAAHIRQILRRDPHTTRETRTAGFCLYVGAHDLAPARFARLFDIAEAVKHQG